MENLNKAIQDRIKKSINADELAGLRACLKATNAAHSIMDAAQPHGIQSSSFAECFQKAATLCALESSAYVPWPPHITWAVHRHMIDATQNPDVWASMISSEKLKKHGVPLDGLHEN
eukprot:3640726-Karenia_brevis.AAC.1